MVDLKAEKLAVAMVVLKELMRVGLKAENWVE